MISTTMKFIVVGMKNTGEVSVLRTAETLASARDFVDSLTESDFDDVRVVNIGFFEKRRQFSVSAKSQVKKSTGKK